jgi:hypothetical protein
MTDHEKAAMGAAVEESRLSKAGLGDLLRAMWKAARAYELPAVCGALLNPAFSCALSKGHDGEHRSPLTRNGGYLGWPREQEPEKLCAECERLMSYWQHRYNEGLASHAFVSAKEPTK